ncbi:MAG: hypothetical protein K0R13_1982 [Propionibacteriaceae bacterium]|jgi:hypothetical protein|nr:hypothetical protein [Propionibacteriaceae bacterium]
MSSAGGVLTAYAGPPSPPRVDQEMVELVSNGALAHSATTTDQEEFCGLVNTLMGPTLGRSTCSSRQRPKPEVRSSEYRCHW